MSFRALYIEEILLENAEYSMEDLAHQYALGTENIIPINHYKDIFNEGRQHVLLQKSQPALILAKKTTTFLQPGSPYCQDFDSEIFYYGELALNCPYACSYCYLQGLYRTGNCVLFVNHDDFLDEVRALIAANPNKTIYLPLTHETDLLAFAQGQALARRILPDLCRLGSAEFEIRTKSANASFFEETEPPRNVMFAFSIAPDEYIAAYEQLTPSLESRLHTIRLAQELGFPVRICLDPVFIEPGSLALYEKFYDKVFKSIREYRVKDMSFGFFRMPKKLYRYCASLYPHYFLYNDDYDQSGSEIQYRAIKQEEALSRHKALLARYTDIGKIHFQSA